MTRQLVRIYRTGDDYSRYSWDNPDRRATLTSFVERYRRYFGRSVLDLGCGGGVLAALLAPTRRSYVGVDANPDMLREARRLAKDLGFGTFVKADITRAEIPGRFDTIALLGNGLAHFTVRDMDRLLGARRANAHPRSTFLIDYRDMIAMFWEGEWTRVKVTTHVRGRIVHRTQRIDLERGRLDMRARPSARDWVLDWSHAIWSPFILEMLMRHHGWLLVHRDPPRPKPGARKIPQRHVDVYRLDGVRGEWPEPARA